MVLKGLGEGDNHKFETEETAFLWLNKTDVDTVKVEYKSEWGIFSTKLWYNGVLKWTRGVDK